MHVLLFHFYSKQPNPAYEEIAAALRHRGHAVWLGAPNRNGDLAWHDGEQVVAVQPGPRDVPRWVGRLWLIAAIHRRLQYLIFMLRVRGFLRETIPDIVQVNANLFAWTLPLLMPSRIHFILDIRQINEGVASSLIGKLKEFQSIFAARINSRFSYDHACFCHERAARRILGRHWSRWGSVVPVGVSERFLSLDHIGPVRQGSEDCVSFIYLGTLSRIRNLERLLFAIQRVLAETNKFRIDFVGPDTAQGFYHDLVDRLQLTPVVAIKPPVPYEEIPELLARYDIGLAYVPDRPTWHYQPAIKALEYRALGLPILSTDVASHREVVEDGVTGLLVRDSVESLAAGLQRFILDHGFLEQCKANAQAMRSGMTWNDIARMYEVNIYRKLRLKGRRSTCFGDLDVAG